MEQSDYTSTQTETTKLIFLRPDDNEEEEEKIETKRMKPQPKKKVLWAEDTVDNENMNRLKSNRIFLKKRKFSA